ncbi:MAG TPA: hypothetical protein VMV89_02400 [Candidatus Paceibacterota bacterium]|nr:hypothetical protein [Candidatus Paceibacterota bacterium]
MPLDDVRAVIIAARRGTISSNFLSGLLETDAIVLHCASPRGVAPVDEFPGASGITPRGERYQPCGWTAPLARTVDLKTFQNQTAKGKTQSR